ncbi:hypothetical protein [Shewanella maritima]|uniref:hypothetical protein n=1 Tax=Shewanella maritima TaxID=2520507 RepID=UPI00373588EC
MQINGTLITPQAKKGQVSLSQAVASNRAVNVSPVESYDEQKQEKTVKAIESHSNESRSPTSELTDSLKSQLAAMGHPQYSKKANLDFDNQTSTHRGAISSYLSTQHAQQRDQIQQMVGIDVFA